MVFSRARGFEQTPPREHHRVALPRVHRRVRGLSPAPVPPFTATRRHDERRERVRGDGSRRGRRIGGDVSRRGRGIQIVRALRTRRARPRGARGGRRAARGEDARGCRSFRDARSRGDARRRASGLRGGGAGLWNDSKAVGVDPRRDRGRAPRRRGRRSTTRHTRRNARRNTRNIRPWFLVARARGCFFAISRGRGARERRRGASRAEENRGGNRGGVSRGVVRHRGRPRRGSNGRREFRVRRVFPRDGDSRGGRRARRDVARRRRKYRRGGCG